MPTWSAAILAGGRGRRLDGRTQPLVELAPGHTMLARQAATLATLGAVPRLIAPDAAPFAGLPFAIVPDLVAAGALGALYTAVATSPTPYVLAIAGDLPFVTAPFLAALLARRGEAEAIVPRPGGRWQPLCGVYHRDVAPRLRDRIDRGHWRVTDALEDLTVGAMTDTDLAPFDPDGRLLLNVNTPEDLQVATRHAAL
ncbi:MAG: molybdenum cofactor guanylyltransferase [Acidobacteria bacterium]|nr:molybdenum cofactor guanylyltransferase [Acidobacteriota bacterium]